MNSHHLIGTALPVKALALTHCSVVVVFCGTACYCAVVVVLSVSVQSL